MNFSEFYASSLARGEEAEEAEEVAGFDADEIIEALREGKMPPGNYLLLHPEARLSDAEKQQLIQGLRATFSLP